jgi:hypothetical protein
MQWRGFVAMHSLADKLGEIRADERDDGVYAQMDIGPVLLEAVGPMFLEMVAGVRNPPVPI